MFRKSYDYCLSEVNTHHRLSCIRHVIGRHENTRYDWVCLLANLSWSRPAMASHNSGAITLQLPGCYGLSADGCRWKDMSTSEQHSAYMFYGRCKAASTAKGQGFLATLQYYDHQGMLNINFLHEWLNTRPAQSASSQKLKRIYVGDAVPEGNTEVGTAGVGDRVDKTVFQNPLRAFSRILQELVSISKRSSNLKDFLERAALHRSDLLR